VEAVNELVNKGIPFREAYRQIGDRIEKGEFHFDPGKGLHHTHEGSIGNLKNAAIADEMNKVLKKF
jgi:argininosuccinate lyase